MSASFKGDTAKLAKLRAMVKQVGSPNTRVALAKTLGADALSRVQLGFRNSEAPDGSTWAALKKRKGKPLLDTARLRSSFSMQPTADGFRVGSNVGYAKFHQFGARARARKGAKVQRRNRLAFRAAPRPAGGQGIPARPMLPGAHLPPAWASSFRDTAERFFSRIMKR